MRAIKKIKKIIADVSLALSAIMLASVAVTITLNVLDRFVIKRGLMWAEQYARYVLIWSVFMSANVLIYRNDLMRVDFIDNFWPAKFKKAREAVYSLIFIVMLSILIWFGWKQAVSYIGVPLIGIPIDKFWVYLCVPVGVGLMMIQYLTNLLLVFFPEEKEVEKT